MKITYVHSNKDIPQGEHWAIIENSSVFVSGDERSRTNPGHGYPEHTENFITYQYFLDKAEFEAELKLRIEYASKSAFQQSPIGIHVAGVVSHKTEVILEERK